MITQEFVLETLASSSESLCLDGRDLVRLAAFFPVSDWPKFGVSLREGEEIPEVLPWTEDEIKRQLARDLEFSFEKALSKRGISAWLMYEVIKMWMWVLEDDLQDFEKYAQYGLPLFKTVAMKYGLPNPIGSDHGDEWHYSAASEE